MSTINRADFESMRKEELVNKLMEAVVRLSQFEEKLLTRREVAERYKLSVACIDKWRAAGVLKAFKPLKDKKHSHILFPLSHLVEFEQSGMQ